MSGRGWGGARPGSGRKPEALSENQALELLELGKERAEKEGKRVGDVILDIIYDPEAARKDRLTACKLWTDLTVVKISEGGEADKALGPAVFLPEHHPRLSVVKTDAA